MSKSASEVLIEEIKKEEKGEMNRKAIMFKAMDEVRITDPYWPWGYYDDSNLYGSHYDKTIADDVIKEF